MAVAAALPGKKKRKLRGAKWNNHEELLRREAEKEAPDAEVCTATNSHTILPTGDCTLCVIRFFPNLNLNLNLDLDLDLVTPLC